MGAIQTKAVQAISFVVKIHYYFIKTHILSTTLSLSRTTILQPLEVEHPWCDSLFHAER